MRLALALGRTREELVDSISSRELSLWIAYGNVIEPIGEGWHQTGLLASLLHNQWAKVAKAPIDFIPIKRPPSAETSPAAFLALFQGMRDGMIARGFSDSSQPKE